MDLEEESMIHSVIRILYKTLLLSFTEDTGSIFLGGWWMSMVYCVLLNLTC